MSLDIGGYPVTIYDTAGLRNKTEDIIEQEGISRARTAAVDADLILIIIDAYQYVWYKSNKRKHNNEDYIDNFKTFMINYINTLNLNKLLETCQNIKTDLPFILSKKSDDKEFIENEDNHHCLIVFNKIDTLDNADDITKICEKYKDTVINISCKTETGFENFLSVLTDRLKTM